MLKRLLFELNLFVEAGWLCTTLQWQIMFEYSCTNYPDENNNETWIQLAWEYGYVPLRSDVFTSD